MGSQGRQANQGAARTTRRETQGEEAEGDPTRADAVRPYRGSRFFIRPRRGGLRMIGCRGK